MRPDLAIFSLQLNILNFFFKALLVTPEQFQVNSLILEVY